MKFYCDITLLPDVEASLGFIWEKVFQQIHIALVETKVGDKESAIGVSFPKYGDKPFPLGDKLRLFARSEALLEQLALGKWLSRLKDYVHCTSVREVPAGINKFACFTRKQFDTSVERLARRRAKRKGESFEQALQYYEGFKEYQTKLPFLNVKSLSKDYKFKLFIDRAFIGEPVSGNFSCYGLSQQTTVPWF